MKNVMTMPFFSIIIPTYNSGKTIIKALNSIINQSFKNYEVLIIDWLSDDNTIGLIQNVMNQSVHIISEIDTGIYDAMNKGIIRASGK